MDEAPAGRCDFCDASISGQDLDESRAMKVLGKNYCPECLHLSIQLAKDPEKSPDHLTPPAHRTVGGSDRRRHVRKDTALPLEVSLYFSNGRLHDRGTAVLRNVSLSGALLTGVLLTGRSVLPDSRRIGIRLLDGPLREYEILGRVVRLEPQNDGFAVGLEFDRTERTKVERLHKAE